MRAAWGKLEDRSGVQGLVIAGGLEAVHKG